MTKSDHLAGWLVAMLVAGFYCWLNLPKDFINGTGTFWLAQNEDITQYVSGFWAYLNSDWQFPLLAIPSLDWPNGTIVTFVDGIPAMALLAKVVHTVIGLNEHVFGYWVVVCVILQATATWYVMRVRCPDNWLVLFVALIFVVGMASFWARIGHLSLLSHFLIIFALGFYFHDKQNETIRVGWWTILLTLAFYINFYNFVMAFAIYLASILDSGRRRDVLKYALPLVLIGVLFPLLMGFPFSRVKEDTGFGVYSMNLLAPFYGGSLIALPSFQYGTHGQGEGFNYLGLGLLAGLCLALYRYERPRSTSFLFILMTLFTIYALSNRIFFSNVQVLEVAVPKVLRSITETFRSSGRFFWPVSYMLAFFVCLRLTRFKGPAIWAVGLVLITVQVVDQFPRYQGLRSYLKRDAATVLQVDEWVNRLAGVQTLYYFPKFKCGDDAHGMTLPMQFVVVNAGVNLTTGYISRYGPQCDTEQAEIASSDAANSAYTFDSKKYSQEQITSWLPAGVSCEQANERIIFCRRPAVTAPQ